MLDNGNEVKSMNSVPLNSSLLNTNDTFLNGNTICYYDYANVNLFNISIESANSI